MHIPKKFRQDDHDHLLEIIRDNPFATLITQSDSSLEANHIPFVLDQAEGATSLHGHVAKANPVWKTIADSDEVLVVFIGPNCYVSPNYYPTKRDHGRAVPTWNYITLHVRGVMSCVHEKAWNLDMLNRLTTQHEAGQEIPWSTADAPADYIDRMLMAIVGLKIEVTSMSGQWKLSQNQPEENRLGVVEGLSRENESNAQKIADLVKRFAL